jgi:hypothetical protein
VDASAGTEVSNPSTKMNSQLWVHSISPAIEDQGTMASEPHIFAGPADLEYIIGDNYLDPTDPGIGLEDSDADSEVSSGRQVSNPDGTAPGVSTRQAGDWTNAIISSQSHISRVRDLIDIRLGDELNLIRVLERPAVTRVRSVLAETLTESGDKKIAKKAANEAKKAECGYVTFSGRFVTRDNGGLDTHSGVVAFDLDDLDDVEESKRRLAGCPHVGAAFLSVSATGLRVLVPVAPIPRNAKEHKAAYAAALPIIEDSAGLKVEDHAGEDLARASFITFDPGIHVNVEAVPVPRVMRSKTRAAANGAVHDECELACRRDYVNRTFKVLDWKSDTQANIECPGLDMHTAGNAHTDCSVWIDGLPSIRCHHNSCVAEVAAAERRMRAPLARGGDGHDGDIRLPFGKIDGKPALQLPGDGRLVSEFCRDLAQLLRDKDLFARNGCAFALDFSGQRLEPVTPDWLRTWIEREVVGYKLMRDKTPGVTVNIKRTLGKEDARAVVVASQLLAGLPRVEFFQPCRMPIKRQSGHIELLPAGYDLESRTFTNRAGPEFPTDMSADQARAVVEDVLAEFPFAPDVGRSRSVAVAAMVTVFAAGLLPRGATRPVFVYQGNAEGCGKTTLAQLAGIPYGAVAVDTAPESEEEWQKKLLAGVIGGRRLM